MVYDREGFEVLCTQSLDKTLEKKVFDREMDANDSRKTGFYVK